VFFHDKKFFIIKQRAKVNHFFLRWKKNPNKHRKKPQSYKSQFGQKGFRGLNTDKAEKTT
jgi:hypothetical protein